MGLFDRFRKKGAPPPDPPAPEEAEDEGVVSHVVILRAGMRDPDEAFAEAVLGARFPEALASKLPQTRLSQPRWFKAENVSSGLRLLAEAMAAETGTDPARATFITCSGPDGAPAALVLLRKPA